MSIWDGFDWVVWHKRHSMVTLLGHEVWNLVISHFFKEYIVLTLLHVSISWFKKRVTKFTSTIFPLSKFLKMLFESCQFLCCWAALQSLCWSLFKCWTVELHWFQGIQGLTEVRWLAVLLSSIISLEEHMDLHDPISNLFRLDEPSQNVNLVHILHSQVGSSTSPSGLLCQNLLSTSAGKSFSTSVFLDISSPERAYSSPLQSEWTTVSSAWFSLLLPNSFTEMAPISLTLTHSSAPWSTPTVLSSASWP